MGKKITFYNDYHIKQLFVTLYTELNLFSR